jgi:hypothetical protein
VGQVISRRRHIICEACYFSPTGSPSASSA